MEKEPSINDLKAQVYDLMAANEQRQAAIQKAAADQIEALRKETQERINEINKKIVEKSKPSD